MYQHDHRRSRRIGMPEAVLAGTKSIDQVCGIVDDLVAAGDEPHLLTRCLLYTSPSPRDS